MRWHSNAISLPDEVAAARNPIQGVAGIAFLEQHLAGRELLGVAEARKPLQLVRTEIGEHRVHLQNDRKFGLFVHCTAFQIDPSSPRRPVSKNHPHGSVSEVT